MTKLPSSKLYSFIDNNDNYAITFFEGQKLINDLAIINELNSESLSFFRDTILSAIHTIQFFKNNEQLGLYIDSQSPFFQFKLEANTYGQIRTLLFPESLESIPNKLSGKIRSIKATPGSKAPYQSIVEMNNNTLEEAINNVLTQSYQVEAKVILSDVTDQSIMISKLPAPSLKNETPINYPPMGEYVLKKQKIFSDIFAQNITSEEQIIAKLQDAGLTYLKGIEINFNCPCSKETMIANLKSIANTRADELFADGNDHVEVRCDYCKTFYRITKDDLMEIKVH